MADLDADGNKELLSGSWPGELYVFKGGAKRTFAAPAKLKNKDGKSVNCGGGLQSESDDEVLVAGDATTEEKDGKTFVVYDGERIEVRAGKQVGITGTASALNVVDWDGDGDLDLIVGNIDGNVYLVENTGTAKEYAFAKEKPLTAGGEPLRVEGDAGPCCADWDADGDADLLIGSSDGSVTLYRNTAAKGAKGVPALGAGEMLVEKSKMDWQNPSAEALPGVRSKICVADWNGDGRLDLLVGDYAQQKRAGAKTSDTPSGEDSESHGWVWLYLRTAPEAEKATAR